MGKKGKGTKKEDKAKKDTTSSKDKLKEALEADEPRPKATPARATSRNTASKKNERSDAIKVGWTESFRWDNKERAPVLPPMPQHTEQARFHLLPVGPKQARKAMVVNSLYLQHGWDQYLQWRCRGDLAVLPLARTSKTLKDGLSGPLSIATMVMRWVFLTSGPNSGTIREVAALEMLESGKPLHIVVVGATAANEEKILRESDYWDELFNLFEGRKVHLYLTGPEMSGKDGVFKRTTKNKDSEAEARSHVECWKANGIDFFLQRGRLELFRKEETVVVGLNSGFGVASVHVCHDGAQSQEKSSNAVLWKWLPTLFFLAALDLPLMFTSSSVEDTKGCTQVLQRALGTWMVQGALELPTPFETSITPTQSVEDKVVRANLYYQIGQGQRPGYSFASQKPDEPANSEIDPRINAFRKLIFKIESWPQHESVRKQGQQSNSVRDRASQLAPLKRYGSYPPEKKKAEEVPRAASKSREASKTVPVSVGPSKEDAAESDGDVLAVEETGGEGALASDGHSSPPQKVKLQHLVRHGVDGEPNALEITVEGVFMAEASTARVGVKRDSVALYYYDCRSLRDVVFEATLPKAVDHSTAKVVFHRPKRSVKIAVQPLGSKK